MVRQVNLKPRSCKAKGKRLQNWVAAYLQELFALPKSDVKSTTMGEGGEDVQLSEAARKVLPFQIECKNRGRMSIYKDYAQAAEHGSHEPLLVIKQDDHAPLVVVNAEWFFNTWYKHIVYRNNDK